MLASAPCAPVHAVLLLLLSAFEIILAISHMLPEMQWQAAHIFRSSSADIKIQPWSGCLLFTEHFHLFSSYFRQLALSVYQQKPVPFYLTQW